MLRNSPFRRGSRTGSEWESFCGRYQRPDDESRIYEIYQKDGKLFYHFVNPQGRVFDLRMYPVGERTFGINEDDFTMTFENGGMTIAGMPCKRI